MAHLAKYSRGAMGQMLSHYDREKKNIGNPEVNRELSHLNYNLAEDQDMPAIEFMRQRLSEVKVMNRDDVNVLCSWVITAPKDLEPEHHREFFEHCYQFCKQEYGAQNVVSAWVHMDETQPHMHFAFIPVVRNKGKSANRWEYKVSAKELITRPHLQDWHPRLEAYLEQQMGFRVNVLNEATKEGNLAIAELKRGTAIKKLEAAELKADEIINDIHEYAYAIREEATAEADYARRNARNIIAEAKNEASEIKSKATEESETIVSGAKNERQTLQIEISLLRVEKASLQEDLSPYYDALDRIAELEEANRDLFEKYEELADRVRVFFQEVFHKFSEKTYDALVNLWDLITFKDFRRSRDDDFVR